MEMTREKKTHEAANNSTDLAWIVSRYGAPNVEQRSVLFPGQALVCVWIAAVAVMNGVAVAAGPTRNDAIAALRMGLTGQLKNLEIPTL